MWVYIFNNLNGIMHDVTLKQKRAIPNPEAKSCIYKLYIIRTRTTLPTLRPYILVCSALPLRRLTYCIRRTFVQIALANRLDRYNLVCRGNEGRRIIGLLIANERFTIAIKLIKKYKSSSNFEIK